MDFLRAVPGHCPSLFQCAHPDHGKLLVPRTFRTGDGIVARGPRPGSGGNGGLPQCTDRRINLEIRFLVNRVVLQRGHGWTDVFFPQFDFRPGSP